MNHWFFPNAVNILVQITSNLKIVLQEEWLWQKGKNKHFVIKIQDILTDLHFYLITCHDLLQFCGHAEQNRLIAIFCCRANLHNNLASNDNQYVAKWGNVSCCLVKVTLLLQSGTCSRTVIRNLPCVLINFHRSLHLKNVEKLKLPNSTVTNCQ